MLDHLCRNRACVNPAARNAAREECENGHLFTGENLIVDKRGWRRCRICKNNWQRESARRRRARRKQQAA